MMAWTGEIPTSFQFSISLGLDSGELPALSLNLGAASKVQAAALDLGPIEPSPVSTYGELN
jgi:hypothetical protein